MQQIYAHPSHVIARPDLHDHLQSVVAEMRGDTACTLLMFDILGIRTLRGGENLRRSPDRFGLRSQPQAIAR